jgi:hypothetical protein
MIEGLRARVALIACLALVSGSLLASAMASKASPATKSGGAAAHVAKKKHKKKHKKKGCIPQGSSFPHSKTGHHEPDPDNRGGPDDGDGCI